MVENSQSTDIENHLSHMPTIISKNTIATWQKTANLVKED